MAGSDRIVGVLSDVLYVFSSTSLLHFAPRDLVYHHNQETMCSEPRIENKKRVPESEVYSIRIYVCGQSSREDNEKALGLKVQYMQEMQRWWSCMHRVPSIRFHILEIVFAIIRSCFI